MLITHSPGCHTSFFLGRGYGNRKYQSLSNSLLYFIVKAGNGEWAIAMLAIFSRLLSPAKYGVKALGLATATIVSAVCFSRLMRQLDDFIQRTLAKRH